MELIMYVRDRKYREIVEERMEVIYKKNSEVVDRKRLWVRLGRAKPIGVVISDPDKEKIGWSLVKYPDHFNKEKALELARYRMNTSTNEEIPHKIIPVIMKMMERKQKVIKNKV
jgi:hypothetical protein